MLAFVDESGDTGMKFGSGSSRFFTVSVVIFEKDDDAMACSKRIQILKREVGYRNDFEFHFNHNPHRVRELFLSAIEPFPFLYASAVVAKDFWDSKGESVKDGESLYKFTCGLAFETAALHLKDAKVKIDRIGSKFFGSELKKYLLNVLGKQAGCIASVKMESASANSLLQLADYIAGAVSWKVQRKRNFPGYYGHISTKEIGIRIWPK